VQTHSNFSKGIKAMTLTLEKKLKFMETYQM